MVGLDAAEGSSIEVTIAASMVSGIVRMR